jgi:hypothetical protein
MSQDDEDLIQWLKDHEPMYTILVYKMKIGKSFSHHIQEILDAKTINDVDKTMTKIVKRKLVSYEKTFDF